MSACLLTRSISYAARVALIVMLVLPSQVVYGQTVSGENANEKKSSNSSGDDIDLAEQKAQEALRSPSTDEASNQQVALPKPTEPKSPSLLSLLFKGGKLMIPIGLMSLLVVAVSVERAIATTRGKVLPAALVDGLRNLSPSQGGFDPRKAYRLCQQYRSTAASVIQAMLLKVGRPHAEVELAVKEASEREAAKLYGPVRSLNLAAAVTPLLGLLGTVWGMIQAFHTTANLPDTANKTEHLAQGIYVALVTTFAGLAVAIPAAIMAHYFEGRIQRFFRDIDELLFNLLPAVERFEGKLRVSHDQLVGDQVSDGAPKPAKRTSPVETIEKVPEQAAT